MHEHVVFDDDGGEQVAMNELQTVRVYKPLNDYYVFDMTIQLSCATDEPVTLLEYRYSGFGWRATEAWDRYNSEMRSSDGRTRRDIDNTRGRWFYVQGEVGGDYAGAEVMSHPDNFNHPEPMRMWGIPEDPDDRGNVFASFSPTRDTDWPLEPGRVYTRKYRFAVYNGHFDKARAEAAWRNFTNKPEVEILVRPDRAPLRGL